MHFAHDTELALAQTAALVNTLSDDGDQLENQAGLDAFFERWPFSGVQLRTAEELAQVRALRGRLRAVWTAPDRDAVAAMVNEILADADAQPYLSKHDQWDWHLHVTRRMRRWPIGWPPRPRWASSTWSAKMILIG